LKLGPVEIRDWPAIFLSSARIRSRKDQDAQDHDLEAGCSTKSDASQAVSGAFLKPRNSRIRQIL
jgi:hypothetical protein